MLDAIREQGSIREACQRVVERLMAELLLGLTPVGDVEEVSLEDGLSGLRVVDEVRLVVDPHNAAVSRMQAIVGMERLARGMRALVRREHALAIVLVEKLEEERRIAAHSSGVYPSIVSIRGLV
jgi:hypothetical protein